ncbi:MAG: 6-phosphogluconolactonase [Paludibacteraceae bacterium]
MLYNRTHILTEPEIVAQEVANMLVAKLKQKESTQQPFNLAISGGSTPNILFGMLAGEYADKIYWETLRIFWVDERCVNLTDKESNYGNAYRIMLSKVPIPEENIFFIKGNEDPVREVKRYREVLKKQLPEKEGLPFFDLVLLGMGNDGHTASIFPDNLELVHSQETAEVARHPQSRQLRITLTGDVICNAGQIVFMVTGRNKAEILESIINEKEDFERYPAYYILTGCDAELYMDYEAAERL